ncbi:MAG: hypothetical protein HOC27_03450 [Phycisphaerae bacterium]|jgi:endonuclease/exonuclease/phosphatase family metal-dependent hydrolase|nr:hypothetical protein [Phycisphaerae bacterium]
MHFLLLLLLATSPIQIDGSFNDWPEGITHQEDGNYVYELIELPSDACLQQLPEQKIVEAGEYTVFFSPKGKGYGVSCKKGDEWISTYDAGVVFAPTTASTKFELRVNKPSITTSFSCKKSGDFRVVSWNVQFGTLLDDQERSTRILKTLQPDVLLLQELDGEDTNSALTEFLNKTLGGTWGSAMSTSTGKTRPQQLRSAVASKILPFAPFKVGEPPLKVVGATITKNEKPINFFSLHLRCCGGPTGKAEEHRQKEAKVIHDTISNMQSPRFILAGDWNLVGTTKPLDIVTSDALRVVNAFQPDGLLNATWSDETSSFTPGRLDWMLYSPDFLSVTRSFVFETSDLDSNTLIEYDLLAEDTAELSDHLPLVADFQILR